MVEPLLLRALRREKVERTPVWIMRQAGRYLPEYRKLRAQATNFLTLCQTPSLAKEVTLQPMRRFSLDAAIVFSDILTIPAAMGLGLDFVEGEGPCFASPLTSVDNLAAIDAFKLIERLGYVMETINLVRAELPLNIPLIGFAGSPFTLACYMVEGKSSRSFSKMLSWVYARTQDTHTLLNFLASIIGLYLKAQIEAGAQVIMLFDTWGGLLNPVNFTEFSLNYMQKIIADVKMAFPTIPIILFSKGIGSMLELVMASSADAIGVDWTVDLGYARRLAKGKTALQGNLDPAVLLTNEKVIEVEVKKVLQAYGKGEGHIFNLGHGITPDVPWENVKIMLDAVQRLSPSYHE
ncbi:MAG: uroporphyrinogen decarboxylase [Legionellales bacterium RIFCSPHIGHO2_12_FULL_37_14]|nr:MAG: uroporphyrinogen decarboxylase [Legionellales bacterium RIFCSPHIGHO2_12_FULL_37_14]